MLKTEYETNLYSLLLEATAANLQVRHLQYATFESKYWEQNICECTKWNKQSDKCERRGISALMKSRMRD